MGLIVRSCEILLLVCNGGFRGRSLSFVILNRKLFKLLWILFSTRYDLSAILGASQYIAANSQVLKIKSKDRRLRLWFYSRIALMFEK